MQEIKDKLFDALMILMKQKDYRKITVSELTKQAGVSRMSYYRNYDFMIDIITDYMEAHYIGKIFDLDDDSCQDKIDLRKRISQSFSFFLNNRVLVENLLNNDLEHLVIDLLDKYLTCTYRLLFNEIGFENDYELSSLVGISYKIFIDWARSGMKEDPDTMADYCIGILYSFRKPRSGKKDSYKHSIFKN